MPRVCSAQGPFPQRLATYPSSRNCICVIPTSRVRLSDAAATLPLRWCVLTPFIHLFAVGRIPTEIGLLTELTTLDLGNSELSGVLSLKHPISWQWGIIGEAMRRVYDCAGCIPTEIGQLTELTTLYLGKSELNGVLS